MEHSKIKAAVPAVAFVAVAALILGVIAMLPYDRPSTTSANSFGNLLNGGYVADGGTMTYYVDGNGALRCESDSSVYYVDSSADTLCPYKNGIIYRVSNGEVRYSAFNGDAQKTLLTDVRQMTVSGDWIFYTRDDGALCKYFISTGEDINTGLAVGQFMISGTAVLYIGDGNRLYTARTDGSNAEPFLAEQVDCFMRFESYIFYTSGGRLYSAASGNTANKQTYMDVTGFNINSDGLLFYTDSAGLHSLDISSADATAQDIEVQGTQPRNLSIAGSYLYYYNAEGQLIRCLKDGSEWKAL